MSYLNVEIPDDLHKKVRQVKDSLGGLPLKTIVCDALNAYIKKHESHSRAANVIREKKEIT